MRAAAIDVGTNSIKMVIGESDSAGNIIILNESSVNARLGKGLASTRIINADAMTSGLNAIGNHVNSARELEVDLIRVVGTNVVRDAKNSSELIELVKAQYNIDLEKLSGDTEARYAFLAITGDAQLGVVDGSQMIIDSGGGSTEMILGNSEQIVSTVSVDVGAVRVTETFLKGIPADSKSLADARRYIYQELEPNLDGKNPSRLVCIGGSAINLARILYGIQPKNTMDVHARKLSLKSLEDLISSLAKMKLDERKQLIGLEPERADIILGGALIIEQVLYTLELKEALISARGLRHAVLFEMLRTGR
ncbi:MAG: Ppx/GppA phosphatase family protein [Armatimonadota bacterium]